ncbi:MAG: hypothetical protein ABEJ31_00320 [Haloarculaceae archaeon]
MKAGVLGLVDGDFDVVGDYAETVPKDDRELQRCLEIDRVFSLPSGESAFAGRAAGEFLRSGESAEIDDGEITVREHPRTETRYTEFAGVPGEFVVVASGSGTFALDLVGAETNTAIERAALDLDAFYERVADATPWKAGFYGTGDDGVNGVFHGPDLRASHDLDALLADSRLNQVGLTYRYDGAELKMTAAASGYVEVYRPRSFAVADYLAYLRREVLPHVE